MKITKQDLILLIVIIYFTFIGGTFYSQLNFFLRVANQVFVTIILGGWLLTKITKKDGLPQTSLDLALLIYLLVNFLSAFRGQMPRFSLETLWFSVVHMLAFYLLVDLIQRGWMPRLAWAVYMAAAVVCIVSLMEFIAWYVGTPLLPIFSQGWVELGGWQNPIPPVFHRVAVAMSGPTPLSAYLALLIPPAIGLIITLPRRDQNRQALIGWLVLAFVIQILTFSRAGILALGVSLPLTGLGWYLAVGNKPDLSAWWRRLSRWHRAVIVLVTLAIIGGAIFWFQYSFSNRTGSTDFRFTLWGAALDIFQDNPITGAGPANFGRALLRLNDASLPRAQIATAHSIYLNAAAELGILGLLAGAYLMAMVGLSWWRRWQQSPDSKQRIRLAACGAALVGLAAQTLVDTYLATPNMLIMLGLIAYIVADLKSVKNPKHRVYTGYIALSILLLYLFAFMWLMVADSHFRKSFRAEGRGNLLTAIDEATLAQSLDPDLPLRTFRLALLEARMADRQETEYLPSAIKHYQLGLQQEPIKGINSANLAGLLWQQGNRPEAIQMLQETVKAEENPLYWVNLGYFFEQEDSWPEAIDAYGQALFLSPKLAGSDFWQDSPARAGKWDAIVSVAGSYLQSDDEKDQAIFDMEIALAQGDFDTIDTIVFNNPQLPPDNLQIRNMLIERYLHREQWTQASNLVGSDPQNVLDHTFLGRINLGLENYEEAEQLFKKAIFLGNQEAGYYLGQVYEQQQNLQAAERAYQQGFSLQASSENIEVTIYDRWGGNGLAPQLLQIGVGPWQARSWLALASLYEKQDRLEDARRIYTLLLFEDPFLEVAQERFDLLEEASH